MENSPHPIDVFNFILEFREAHLFAVFQNHRNDKKNAQKATEFDTVFSVQLLVESSFVFAFSVTCWWVA